MDSRAEAAEWHKRLITNLRYKEGGSEVSHRPLDEEATSDRSRVVYSSAFRRLQQKTQVFTVAKDAAVRSRLTHSLEVADVGRWIAQKVVDKSLLGSLDPHYCAALVTLVETGCLAHDIGNPPFGHFGEEALKQWFVNNWKQRAGDLAPGLEQLVADFLQFDGNPQGMRILTRLQGRTRDERKKYGMDLTYSQVLTALKYPRSPLDDDSRWKKPGFFESERSKIEPAWKALGFGPQQRFPLAYIVEAADDISYCISDMEDGIDQGILTPETIFGGVKDWIRKSSEDLKELRGITAKCAVSTERNEDAAEAKDHFIYFKTHFARLMIEEAARCYGDGSRKEIREGTLSGLLDGTDAGDLLDALKQNARRYLYPADKVQKPFLAGLRIVQGILDEYGKLLQLPRKSFDSMRAAWRSADRKKVKEAHLEVFLPMFDGLPAHYLETYDSSVGDKSAVEKWGPDVWEWFCRAHLIVDYVSGMTDDFSHRTYQVISGAELE